MIFVWTFYDHGNQTLKGKTPFYTWRHVGTYEVKMNVTWSEDRLSGPYYYDNVTVKVIPLASAGPSERKIVLGIDPNNLVFNGSDSQSDLGIVSWTWTVKRGDTQLATLTGEVVNYTFARTGHYNVTLTVKDNGSGSAWTTIIVSVSNQPSYVEKHIVIFGFWLPLIVIIALLIFRKLQRDRKLITKTDIEKGKLQFKNAKKTWTIFRSNRLGFGGFIVLFISWSWQYSRRSLRQYHTRRLPWSRRGFRTIGSTRFLRV